MLIEKTQLIVHVTPFLPWCKMNFQLTFPSKFNFLFGNYLLLKNQCNKVPFIIKYSTGRKLG